MSLEISSHCRQLVGCQMPNFFSRIAGLSPRLSTASRKLLAIVSATVSTAIPAMPASSLWSRPHPACRLRPVLMPRDRAESSAKSFLTPRFLLLPAPLSPRARFLGAEVKFLDVLRIHQPLAGIVHDDAADLQHIAVMGRFQRHFGVLLDQEDGGALLFVNALDDGENLLHQDRRQAERGLVQKEHGRTVIKPPPDPPHFRLPAD